MDFSMVGLDNFNSTTTFSNNGSFTSSENANNQKWFYGSGFMKPKRTNNEEELREYYHNKVSSSDHDDQQMLSFSSSNSQTSMALMTTNTGSGSAGMNGLVVSGIRGPFTPSQWMELEHQALIFKYIIANVPIPSYLLNPIRKALESAFPSLRSNALGWGGFHLGFSNADPEPGRCRRTDGKKWRCSRNAVAEHKYCERHMNRGRHRSRKPVEGHTASGISTTKANQSRASENNADRGYQNPTILSTTTSPKVVSHKDRNSYDESCRPEFGLVCHDSLLNPLNSSSSLVNTQSENLNDHQNKSQNALRQFMDEWPKNQSQHNSVTSELLSSTSTPNDINKLTTSPLKLSRELEATQMGLGVGNSTIEQSQKQTSWAWQASTGGPLGEVLHTTGECKRTKALNLMTESSWTSSPRGVLRRDAVGSIGSGLVHSSLPAL